MKRFLKKTIEYAFSFFMTIIAIFIILIFTSIIINLIVK